MMLGSLPLSRLVAPNQGVINRFHINGNALYHVGDAAFMDMLRGARGKGRRLAGTLSDVVSSNSCDREP